jgi:hypothetical protein
MALNTGLRLEVDTSLTKTDGLASASADVPWTYGFQWPDGTAAGTANRLYQGRRTLAASTTEDLDLAAVLTDSYGVAITFARIRALIVKAAAANTNNVIVGAAASNQFVGPFGAATHTIAVQPDGLFVVTAPGTTAWTVTAGTGDLLKVANSGAGTSVTYDIFLIGASA